MSLRYPLVSVIIPAYNAEDYISECISSVINQTHKNIEIIVVNDGSTDNTKNILEKINDSRLLIVNQENKGCSASKNTGLSISKGDYIQYLDADDYLSIDKIQIQVELLQSMKNSIAVCKTLIISNDNLINNYEIDTEMISEAGSGKEFLLRLLGIDGKFGMVQPNAYLIPRNVTNKIGPWNEEISPSPDEDGEYFARALCCINNVIFTGGINYYRKLSNQSSLSKEYSFQRVSNLLKTVDLKFQHIFNLEKSNRTQKLYQLNISQVAYQFGHEYPSVITESLLILSHNKYKKLQVIHPKKFALISKIIGFRNAMSISFLKRKVFK